MAAGLGSPRWCLGPLAAWWLRVVTLAALAPPTAAPGPMAAAMAGMTIFGFASDLLGFYDMISSSEVQQRLDPRNPFDRKYFSAVPKGVPFSGFHLWTPLMRYKYENDFMDDDEGVSWGDCFTEIFTISLAATEKGCSGDPTLGATMAAIFTGYYGGSLNAEGAAAINASSQVKDGLYLTSIGLVPKYVWVRAGASLDCKLDSGIPVNTAAEGENVLALLTMSMSCTYGGTQGTKTTKSRSIQVFADGRVILGAVVGPGGSSVGRGGSAIVGGSSPRAGRPPLASCMAVLAVAAFGNRLGF